MRDIKFRFFSNQTDKYVSDPEDYAVTGDGKIYCITDLSTYREFRELSDCLCKEQYTGLKDKNGVEIYEGDIVESDFYEPHIDGIVAIVEYRLDEIAFTFVNSRGDINGEQDAFKYGGLKVIGSIHQNPELIND